MAPRCCKTRTRAVSKLITPSSSSGWAESCEAEGDGVLSLSEFCRPASGIVDTSPIHSCDVRNPAGGFKFSRSTLSRRRRNASLLTQTCQVAVFCVKLPSTLHDTRKVQKHAWLVYGDQRGPTTIVVGDVPVCSRLDVRASFALGFKLTPEVFDARHYGGLGIYKLAIWLLNLAPYVALRIVGH